MDIDELLLVPEMTMEVADDPNPLELSEMNNGTIPPVELVEDDEVDIVATENQEDTSDEIPTEEQNGGEVVTISPALSDDVISIPHNEQNGDVVDLDGEHENESNHNDVEVNRKEADTVPCETIINCDTILTEDNVPLDSFDVTEDNTKAELSVKKKKRKYLLPVQIPNDYTPEELGEYNKSFGRGQQAIEYLRLHCTACNAHLGSAPNKQYKRFIHPLLRVLICKDCYIFYGSGEFDKDEDGSELYCRWCGQGGKVLCCASCAYVFCQRCIKNNLGKAKLQEVLDSEDWKCFDCVPSQTIRLRVIVRALYDFVQSEINLAAEQNQPERLKVDHSLCCVNRASGSSKIKIKLPSVKRKNTASPNNNLINDDIYPKKKKIKLKTLSSLLNASKENPTKLNQSKKTFINPLAVSARSSWVSQTDEDEVVCTPDLSLLMPEEDEESVEPPQAEQAHEPPSLTPISNFSNTNKNSQVTYTDPLQSLNTFASIRPPPRQLGYRLPSKPMLLKAPNARPLLSKVLTKVPNPNIRFSGLSPSVGVSIIQSNRNNVIVPSKIIPGTKYEWFEKASQYTSRVNSHLSTRLTTLTQEQSVVSSLEGLATIHNNFQEILNSSIKSLTQIRKNLRNDFIAGLKTYKYDSTEKEQPKNTTPHDDNDVIIVDAPSPVPVSVPTTSNTVGRLKLKPVSSLLMENAVITIPDDVFEPPPPRVRKVTQTVKPQTKACETVTATTSLPVEEVKDTLTRAAVSDDVRLEIIEEDVNPETRVLIKHALEESKFELIVAENLKAKVSNEISTDMLRKMVSVRVILENKFGPATPRMRPRRGYTPMTISKEDEDDIENMLSSSIVLNISKHKVFNNDDDDRGQSESILAISDNVEHLSNGIL